MCGISQSFLRMLVPSGFVVQCRKDCQCCNAADLAGLHNNNDSRFKAGMPFQELGL